MRVLLVEDDLSISRSLEKALSNEGFTVDAVNTGEAALFLVTRTSVDVVILDIGLPDMDGLSVLKKIREHNKSLPVILLTARDRIEDKVDGLDRGADDYLTKPFSFSELIARIEALNRRQNPKSDIDILEVHDLLLNKRSRKVTRNSVLINLQPQEYKLLEVLMENSNEVITRTMLLEKVWDLHFDPQTNIIDVHISRLRKKIDKDHKVQLLHTIRGAGYSIQFNKV